MSDEVRQLLRHPDPRERALALRLDSVSPDDLAIAVLDPDPLVWKTAFGHPHSQHALDVLASVSRDAAGNPIHDRHDLLLKDPRCHEDHIDSMRRAIQQDTYLPIQDQVGRLSQLQSLRKDEGPTDSRIVFDQPSKHLIKSTPENEPFIHGDLHQIYSEGVKTAKPLFASEGELEDTGSFSKAVYNIPGNEEVHKFIVKPYHDPQVWDQGWNEATSQHLYHAANLGHVHQKSFVGEYNNGKTHIPATVIHVEQAKPITEIPKQEILAKNPGAPEEARKLAIMDFLTSNSDRHTGNLMVKDDGKLLAIDHGMAFSYSGDAYHPEFYEPKLANGSSLKRYARRAPSRVVPYIGQEWESSGNGGLDYHNTIKHWWPEVSADVRRAFEQRLELIKDPEHQEHLRQGFMARHKWLDDQARASPDEFFEALKKAIQDPVYSELVDPVPEAAAKRYPKLHDELLNAHPQHLQPKVAYFERNVNNPNSLVKPETGQLDGCEEKALVKHGGNTYLIKSAHNRWSHLSGWAEMTNQAMYHAGGIGHLHQDVHAANLNIKDEDGNIKQHPVVVIHFKPGKWTSIAYGAKFSKKAEPELRKAYLLDFLAGNSDRHSENAMVDSKGNSQMIDHGFCFRRDDWGDPNDQEAHYQDPKFFGVQRDKVPFNYGLFERHNVLNKHGYLPDEETFSWWDKSKDAIKEAFNKHLQMLPDKDERARRKAFFDKRFLDIETRHPVVAGEGLAKGAMARIAPFNPRTSPMKRDYGQAIEGWVIKERRQNREQALHKSLGNAEFLHDQHYAFKNQKPINLTGVHEKLMKSHPAAVNPGVRHFEIAINKHGSPVAPVASQKEMQGIQEKAMYSHNSKNYIVKPANEKATSLGAWNELTSQAMYHAGGIGHLHQKVHATVGRTNANRQEPAHALAIHAEPDSMTFFDAYGWTQRHENGKETIHPSKDRMRADNLLRNKDLGRNMGLIGVMDYLTSNPDRHGHNIILKRDGSPIAIDHSRSFWGDRKHALGNEYEGELGDYEPLHTSDAKYQNQYVDTWENHQNDSAAPSLGVVDNGTLDWWNNNKGAILDKLKEHLNMLPDPEMRQRMMNSYMVRHNRLEGLLKQHIYKGGQAKDPVIASGIAPTELSPDKTLQEVA